MSQPYRDVDPHTGQIIAKHTVGPWSVSHLLGDVYIHGEQDNATVSLAHVYARDEFASLPLEANARLIAAAPELLAACEAAYIALPMAKHNEETNAALKAAIQKAGGQV